MVVKLYTTQLSPPVAAAIMACDIFNVTYENEAVDQQNMSADFVRKNPMKTLPVLEDGDLIVHDSYAILMYLADAYGKNDALYPKDAKSRALVNQKLFFNGAFLFPRFNNAMYVLVMEKKALDKKSLENVDEGYALMEGFLNKTAYVATKSITIADISIYSNMSCLVEIVPLDEKKFPKTNRWCNEMKKQPYCLKHNNPSVQQLCDYVKKCQASTSK